LSSVPPTGREGSGRELLAGLFLGLFLGLFDLIIIVFGARIFRGFHEDGNEEKEPDDPGEDGVVDDDDDVAEEEAASARRHELLDDVVGNGARADPGTAGGRVCGLGNVDGCQLDKRQRHGLGDKSRPTPPADGFGNLVLEDTYGVEQR